MKRIQILLTLGLLVVSLAASGLGQVYRLRELPAARNGRQSWAFDIASSGQIAGASMKDDDQSVVTMLWESSGVTEFSQSSSTVLPIVWGLAINGRGLIVGKQIVPNFPFGTTSANFAASKTYAPTGTEFFSANRPAAALDVNDANVAVGWRGTGQIQEYWPVQRAYLARNVTGNPIGNTVSGIDLGTLGGELSQATAINELGQIVGWSFTSSGPSRAFFYDGGALVDLGVLTGGTASEAQDINDDGIIVGWSTDAAGGQRAVIFRGATVEDLGTLGGQMSDARGINGPGQIVGSSWTATGAVHAFLYTPATGTMHDLDELIDPTLGWTIQAAEAIDDCGRIVGSGIAPNGQVRAFLLEPNAPVAGDVLPGQAGVLNTIDVTGFLPGEEAWLLGSLQAGSTPLPGCQACSTPIELATPIVVASGIVDGRGSARFQVTVPPALSGRTIHLQAVTPSDCRLSNRVTVVFP